MAPKEHPTDREQKKKKKSPCIQHSLLYGLPLGWVIDRSIYPGCLVASPITFGIVEDTSPTSSISFTINVRASYYKYVCLGPQDLNRSLGKHVRPYTETRQPIRPKHPAVPRGVECYKAYHGLGNRSIYLPR